MGLSIGGFRPYPPALLFGRQAPSSPSDAWTPQATSESVSPQEKAKIDQLQARYAHLPGCGCCSPGSAKSADEYMQKVRDTSRAEVMAHETAHKSAAGSLAGAIQLNTDSNGVTTGGSVPITLTAVNPANPEEACKNNQIAANAANAPDKPSSQDRNVYTEAMSRVGQAQVLMSQKNQAKKLGLPVEEFRRQGFTAKPAG